VAKILANENNNLLILNNAGRYLVAIYRGQHDVDGVLVLHNKRLFWRLEDAKRELQARLKGRAK